MKLDLLVLNKLLSCYMILLPQSSKLNPIVHRPIILHSVYSYDAGILTQ